MALHDGRQIEKALPPDHDVRHYEGQDLEALADMPNYTNWLLKPFRPHLDGRVIELGAGIGNVSVRWVQDASSALLVEPANHLHDRLRARVSAHGHVRTSCGLLEEVPAELVEQPFDSALLVNVLEHIPDHVATLQGLNARLNPGGHLLLFVPAFPWLYGSLDTLVHHCRRYTKASLRQAVEVAGFQVEALRYCDALGVLPWLIMGRVLRRKRFDPGSVRLYDRVGVPLTALVEARIVPPLGKSLWCVAQKPLT